jgi:tetratricopeptide (TPR) repeat protein
MFDPRALERSTLDLTRLLQEQELDSLEDANEFLASVIARDDIPKFEPQTPIERAQDKMYDAWAAQSKRKRVRLAKQALKISPDCADAYVLLAEETGETPEISRELYRAGIEAGERALGPEAFERDKGEFWGLIETRPFMRALEGLATTEMTIGNVDEAMAHFRRMLELNTNDNQGARYLLLGCLLEVNDTASVHILLRQYRDDISAQWAYGRALVTFLERGNTRHSRANLQDAVRRNLFFPMYLLGVIPVPDTLPEYIEIGTESEGIECLIKQGRAWLAHERAVDWLVDVMPSIPPM